MEPAPSSLNRSVSGPARATFSTNTNTANRQYSTTSNSSRVASMGRFIKSNTANFFGIGDGQLYNDERWANRRNRLLSKKYGRLKSTTGIDDVDGSLSAPITREIASPLDRMQSSTASVSSYRGMRTARRRYRKDSALRVTYDGLSTLMSSKKRPQRTQSMVSRTYAPASFFTSSNDNFVEMTLDRRQEKKVAKMISVLDEDLSDEVFFDLATPTSPPPQPFIIPEIASIAGTAPMMRGWRRKPPQPLPSITAPTDEVDGKLEDRIMVNVVYNSDRRQYGKGFLGGFIKTTFKRMDSTVDKELSEIEDVNFRPYFTYWITFVQIVIYIVSVCVYGLAPIGFSQTFSQAEVLTPRLAIEQVSRVERDNLWIGPRPEDLIHLGAKYSPCMRKDSNIYALIQADRKNEAENAGCCVRNDGAGCYLTMKGNCSSVLSTFVKWGPNNYGPNGRTSGAVCGQDPNYCIKPSSVVPFLWPDDISRWPICRQTNHPDPKSRVDLHMSCEVVGHPCCTGIRGECIITTREHCDFLRGYFHEEAFACSQVNCLHEICGMIPFGDPDAPDQFYRLVASLFLHAGLLHLIFTILYQLLVMRDLEKMMGPIRMGFLYLGSGIAGNLSSAIFLPYLAEAGPSGCQFGVLACLIGEYVLNWPRIDNPWIGFFKLSGLVVPLFLLGLLPWIDNYAHLIGFVFGLLLSFLFLPFISFGKGKVKRILTLVFCTIAVVVIFAVLLFLFYVVPIYECPNCQFFTCIPITPTFCENMAVKVERRMQFT